MAFLVLLLQRLGRLLLTIVLISSLVFLILRVLGGDPASVVAGATASPEEVQSIRVRMGTDKPILDQYSAWMLGLARLDFGNSLVTEQESVRDIVFSRLPVTVSLAFLALAVSLLLSIPIGVMSALRRWTAWDYVGMLFSQIGIALPEFWLGIILLLVFSVWLQVLPLYGSDTILHLILPALTLGISRAAVLVRVVRLSLVEELNKEYIITARSKGLKESIVVYRHALKNALLPMLTVSGIQFGYLLSGSIIVEQIFSLPGLGRLLLTAIGQRDFPVIQGSVVLFAVIFSTVNFLVDMLYSMVDPRIRAR